MKKKIVLGSLTLVAVAAGVAGLSAFEAHVINVTAQIENALQVETNAIEFGTVFPQEHLDQPLEISLSRSFLSEDRVDDVNYIIRQKPKCAITSDNGESFDPTSTATGHVVVDPVSGDVRIECGEEPRPLVEGETWDVLPSLCEYLSKHPDNAPENDGSTPAFHHPFSVVDGVLSWLDTDGRLAKSEGDEVDTWTIDLAVPCFGNHCAQDWEEFVADHNEDADADEFVQDIGNEHKIFGCDLWVEVTEVSETPVSPSS